MNRGYEIVILVSAGYDDAEADIQDTIYKALYHDGYSIISYTDREV